MRKSKKKLMCTILAMLMTASYAAALSGCQSDSGTQTSTQTSTISKVNSQASESGEKLLGKIIPEPTMKFDIINANSDLLYCEVKNSTEQDFRDYVESCKPYGFDGYIKSAEMPTYYFSEQNDAGYSLEVRFEEKEQSFSISITKPTGKLS